MDANIRIATALASARIAPAATRPLVVAGIERLAALIDARLASAQGADDVRGALDMLARKPEQDSRRQVLADALSIAGIDKDAGIIALADELLGLCLGQGAPPPAADNGGSINTGGGAYVGGNAATGRDFTGRDTITINHFHSTPQPGSATPAAGGADDKQALAPLLSKYFDLNDIDGLCFDLGYDSDNIGGDTKDARIRALLAHCAKIEELPKLKAAMLAARPNLRGRL